MLGSLIFSMFFLFWMTAVTDLPRFSLRARAGAGPIICLRVRL